MILLIIKEHYMSIVCFFKQETCTAGAFLLYPHELIFCFNYKNYFPSYFGLEERGRHPHITDRSLLGGCENCPDVEAHNTQKSISLVTTPQAQLPRAPQETCPTTRNCHTQGSPKLFIYSFPGVDSFLCSLYQLSIICVTFLLPVSFMASLWD